MVEYQAFYEENREKLFAFLMRMTGDISLSADIMQETFTRHIEHYGKNSLNITLLFAIARNILIDHNRKKKRPNRDVNREINDTRYEEHRLLVRDEFRRVYDAIQKLDDDEKEVLSLAISGVGSYKKIAEILKISEANIKIKIHRARVKLKKVLNRGDE